MAGWLTAVESSLSFGPAHVVCRQVATYCTATRLQSLRAWCGGSHPLHMPSAGHSPAPPRRDQTAPSLPALARTHPAITVATRQRGPASERANSGQCDARLSHPDSLGALPRKQERCARHIVREVRVRDCLRGSAAVSLDGAARSTAPQTAHILRQQHAIPPLQWLLRHRSCWFCWMAVLVGLRSCTCEERDGSQLHLDGHSSDPVSGQGGLY